MMACSRPVRLLGAAAFSLSVASMLVSAGPPSRPIDRPGDAQTVIDPAAVRAPSFVPPPAELYGPRTAQFFVTYGPGFPAEAKAAFQHAANIWAGLINSSVPINIQATWEPLGSFCGFGGPYDWFKDYPNALVPGTFSAVAIANARSGTDLDPSHPDITVRMNSSIVNGGTAYPWYFGTDGNVSTTKIEFDFVTCALHELAHGLGFIGSAQLINGLGYLGTRPDGGTPDMFDRFVANGQGQYLWNKAVFPNPSQALLTQFTGGNLFFRSPAFLGLTASPIASPAKLWAPATFVQGTSYLHLDGNTYPPNSTNGLMGQSIQNNVANHNPGPITLGIFSDIGWPAVAGPPGPPTGCFTVSPMTVNVPATGQNGVITVTATSNTCSWSAQSNVSWITNVLTGGLPGTPVFGSGAASYTVAPNSGAARTGTMTVAGATVTINQEGTTGPPAPTTMLGGATAGTGTCAAGFWHTQVGASSVSYAVPPGTWRLRSWTMVGTANEEARVSFLVLRPTGATSFFVVHKSQEFGLAAGLNTFDELGEGVEVMAGDRIGFRVNNGTLDGCFVVTQSPVDTVGWNLGTVNTNATLDLTGPSGCNGCAASARWNLGATLTVPSLPPAPTPPPAPGGPVISRAYFPDSSSLSWVFRVEFSGGVPPYTLFYSSSQTGSFLGSFPMGSPPSWQSFVNCTLQPGAAQHGPHVQGGGQWWVAVRDAQNQTSPVRVVEGTPSTIHPACQ